MERVTILVLDDGAKMKINCEGARALVSRAWEWLLSTLEDLYQHLNG
jgi:hypothetical protein